MPANNLSVIFHVAAY